MAGPTSGGPVDLPRLPWSVCTYGPNGFAQEHPMGRPKFHGLSFSLGHQSYEFSLSLSFALSSLHSLGLS